MTETEVTQTENAAEEIIENKETPPEGHVIEDKDKKPWFQKRFDRFTAQNQSLARERDAALKTNEALLQELANLRAGKNEDGGRSNLSPVEIDKLAEVKAKEIVAAERFNEKCNSVYEKGSEEFPDFKESVAALNSMGIMTPQFLDLVTDLDASHKVIHHLGGNPEEADRIQALSPAKQALALAKLEASLEKPGEKATGKAISNAPPPIKTVESKAKGTGAYGAKYYDNMPMEEYTKWRDSSRR